MILIFRFKLKTRPLPLFMDQITFIALQVIYQILHQVRVEVQRVNAEMKQKELQLY